MNVQELINKTTQYNKEIYDINNNRPYAITGAWLSEEEIERIQFYSIFTVHHFKKVKVGNSKIVRVFIDVNEFKNKYNPINLYTTVTWDYYVKNNDVYDLDIENETFTCLECGKTISKNKYPTLTVDKYNNVICPKCKNYL